MSDSVSADVSLILGINCQAGTWLAADTRLTIQKPSGLYATHDDFLKFESLGSSVHLTAAGDAALASYIVRGLKDAVPETDGYKKFRSLVVGCIGKMLSGYPRCGGTIQKKRPKTVFIFGGIDVSERKQIDVSVLADDVRRRQDVGSGPVVQSLDKSLVEAMIRKAFAGERGSLLTTNLPFSGLCAVSVDTTRDRLENMVAVEDAGYGDYFMFGEDGLTKEQVPRELFSEMDLEPQTGTNLQVFQKKVMCIVAFYKTKIIPRFHLGTVGGSITVFLATEDGAKFPTGKVGMLDPAIGKLVQLSSLSVIDGKFHIDNGDGWRPLRMLRDYREKQDQMDLAAI